MTLRGREDTEVPYRLNGDTLTLEGGDFQIGGRAGRPALLRFSFKGEWKRADVKQEECYRKAFAGVEVDGYAIKVESQSQRLAILANRLTIQADGRVRLEQCVISRLAEGKESDKPGGATVIHSHEAVLQLKTAARAPQDLGRNPIVAIDLAGGIRMSFQEP